ncbi:MAG: hypothetical protein ACTSVI_11885 [Promethearchaeota archaeon]
MDIDYYYIDKLHALILFFACIWFFTVALNSIIYTISSRKKEGMLLTIFFVLEGFFSLFLGFYFKSKLECVNLIIIAIDFMIASLVIYDVLFYHLFCDTYKYNWIIDKKNLIFYVTWAFVHVFLMLDTCPYPINLSLLIDAFVTVGLGLCVYMSMRFSKKFKELISYIQDEKARAQDEDVRDVIVLVHKQYVMLRRSFKIFPNIFALGVLSFILHASKIFEIIAMLVFIIVVLLLFVASSFQFLGFFYPIPRWPKARN